MTLEEMKDTFSMLNPETQEGYETFKGIVEAMHQMTDEEALGVLRELKAISKEKLYNLADEDPAYFSKNISSKYSKLLNIAV